MNRKIPQTKWIIQIFLSMAAILTLIPIFWMITSSLKSTNEIFAIPQTVFPKTIDWNTIFEMWKGASWGIYFLNTTIITVTVIVGQLIVCSMAAYGFSRIVFPGRDILFLLCLGTMMIPFQVIMIPLFKILKTLGWVNSLYALIVPGIFTAFSMFLLRQFFIGIPKELEEAAIIDGCGHIRIFWEIIIKNSVSALTTCVIFTFMYTWNDFIKPMIYLNDPKLFTLSLGLAKFQGTYVTKWNELMAAGIISMIPVVIIFLVAQKYFVQGIVMSGIKG